MNITKLTNLALATSATVLATGIGFSSQASAAIVFTIENPGVQSSTANGTLSVENFDSLATGSLGSLSITGVGTMNTPTGGTSGVYVANQYGGAGGVGKYYAQEGNGNPTYTEIILNNPNNYFGFWWSAGNAGNNIEFLDNSNNVLASFTTQTVINYLNTLPPATKAQYYGNPNPNFLGQDPTEAFAFINFTGTSGTTWTKIRLSGNGFESDNFTFATDVTQIPGNGPNQTVPEPGTVVGLLAFGVMGIGSTIKRKLNQK